MSAVPPLTVAVLIALQEEHDTFLEIFPKFIDRSVGRHVCLEHEVIPNVKLLSVLAEQMGSESAGVSAQIALDEFKPDIVLLLGIAGAISTDLKIGDVCVSNEIIDVLQNAKVFDKGNKTEIMFAPNFYTVGAELVSSFTFLRSHPALKALYEDWQLVADGDAATLGIGQADFPSIHIGPIACGPVVASKRYLEKLKLLHRKVLAIETESGGVGSRVQERNTAFLSIRGISDMADDKKSALEKETAGSARKLAMKNACNLLHTQLQNNRFVDAVIRISRTGDQSSLFPVDLNKNVVSELEQEIRLKISEYSAEFKSRPDDFYLPIPRARRITYGDDALSKELDDPENLFDAIKEHNRVFLRLPRSFPAQGLGWSLANSFIRQQIGNKVVLPYVIQGDRLAPPKSGLIHHLPEFIKPYLDDPSYHVVILIDEPAFDSRSKIKFLSEELKNFSASVMILTKSEDSPTAVDNLISDTGCSEYEISPVSFSETAFFLEKAFDMNPHEAEAVAIRLDDTFRKFRLEAHPTYFAGLQEETLAALINANKRAELIQLAVDGLLTLMVAADRSKPRLSRTTRERFLKWLAHEIAKAGCGISDENLVTLANKFIKEYAFDANSSEFLVPFFYIGILYRSSGQIRFAHPYLESYLLAQALREDESFSLSYFDPKKSSFDYYTYDLYCEMGPHESVMNAVQTYATDALDVANFSYRGEHIYLEKKDLTTIHSKNQLAGFVKGLGKTAEKLEKPDTSEDVRATKQRLLDAKHHVRTQVGTGPNRDDVNLPDEIKTEFDILDGLARALSLTATGVGSGSESMTGACKRQLAQHVLMVGAKFADIWTRNRLRVNFNEARSDTLSDEKIWKFIEEIGAPDEAYAAIKAELSMMMHGFEINYVAEPMGRVLSRISSMAGVKVLEPVVCDLGATNVIEQVILNSWLMDINPEKGKDGLKDCLSSYKGSNLLRLVLASHLLQRVFWHHYQTAGALHFVAGAKRALAPLGLEPPPKRIEAVSKGPKALGSRISGQ